MGVFLLHSRMFLFIPIHLVSPHASLLLAKAVYFVHHFSIISIQRTVSPQFLSPFFDAPHCAHHSIGFNGCDMWPLVYDTK